jgi:hypothetical protein
MTPEGDGLERRPSNPYSQHHRQTSIVHGSIQHSRNPSFASSTTMVSSLSPEVIQSTVFGAGLGTEPPLNGKRDLLEVSSSFPGGGGGSNGSGHLTSSSLSTIQDSDQADAANDQYLNRKITSSGKLRWEHSHQQSHSKHQNLEAKTVGEYALHHLFNSVCVSC